MILKFNEYLKEEFDEVIDVDAQYAESNADALNADFDLLTEKPYQNAPIFLNQLRGTLERYGMMLPASATPHFLNLSAELVYMLGDSGKYLYIVYDTNDDGYVDGYAQVVSDDELQDLIGMDRNELLNSDRNLISIRHSDFYRKRDDDAGNTDEY
jgi:hypothetical protein